MKKILFSIIVPALLLFSCNNSDSSADTNVPYDSSLSKSVTTLTTPASSANQVVGTDSAGAMKNMVQTTLPAQNASVPANVTGAGLNPAHGQPGHRCDIAVGAPLNSASAKTNSTISTNTAATPATVQPTITANAPKTAPGMNPAHGQPGHRCDISVGAPLNSAPAKPVTATSTPAVTPDKAKAAAADMIAIPAIATDSSGKK